MAGALPQQVQQFIGQVPSTGNDYTNTTTGAVPLPPAGALPYMPGYVPSTLIQGTGGYVSPAAQFISGEEAGMNMSNAMEINHRRAMQFREQEAARRARAAAAYANGGGQPGGQGDPNNPPPSLWSHIGHGAHDIGSAAMDAMHFIEHLEGGGPVSGIPPVGHPLPLPFVAPQQNNGVEPSLPAQPGQSGYAAGGPVASPVPAPAASAPVPAQAPGAGIVPPTAPPAPISPQQLMATHANEYAMMLHGSALNDQGVPNSLAASGVVPNLSSGSAPAAGTGQPHSLTPDFWDATDARARNAAVAAAKAGQDPSAVYHNLIAMRNSFFQGEVLKNLSAANQASIAGDQAGVEKALRNVYYYMPDGRDLQFHHGVDGKLQYQDPIYPYLDAKGNPSSTPVKGGKPNYEDVTPEHLQLIGQAALHPMSVASTMLQYRMIPFQMHLMNLEAQGKYLTGEGQFRRGTGIEKEGEAGLGRAKAQLARVPFENMLDQAESDRAMVQAGTQRLLGTLLQGSKLSAQAAANVKAASHAFDNIVLGPPTQVPVAGPGGAPNLSPAAGKVVHNSTKIPGVARGMTGVQYSRAQAVVAGLSAMGMPAPRAAQMGLLWMQLQGQTHPVAQDKSPLARAHKGAMPDVIPDQKHGRLWFWDTKTHAWTSYPFLPQGASMLTQGAMQYQQALIGAIGEGQYGGGIPVPHVVPTGAPSAIDYDMSPYASSSTP